MSLRYEQYRSLHRTRQFLLKILETPHKQWTSKELKQQASDCLRHYPILNVQGKPLFSQDDFDCPPIEDLEANPFMNKEINWTNEQVKSLEERQQCGYFNKYKCKCGETTIPTTNGWKCGSCNEKSEFAFEFDLNGGWKKAVVKFEEFLDHEF